MNDQLMKDAQYAKYLANRNPNRGKILFVNMSGDDNNPGNKPECPIQSFDAALTLCTNDYDDYIFVLDAYSVDTEPIVVDKSKVHIIGINNPQSVFVAVAPGTDVAVFNVTANNVEIAGFAIGGGINAGGILLTSVYGTWIHHNTFGHKNAGGTPKYGIYQAAGGSTDQLIEDNRFLGSGNNAYGLIGTDGIYLIGNHNTIIRRNILLGIPGVAISITSDDKGLSILDNRIMCDADTAGAAITLAAATNGIFVDGNRANFGRNDAMGNNPYVDSTGDDSNTWGLNWKGGASAYPA